VRSTTARANEAPRKAESPGATTVHISAEARRLSAASPPVDLAKVHRLREALATNTYVVQPARIAHAMLEAAA
jgi:flagellar biosynthesis anti-sigma factor FlgM